MRWLKSVTRNNHRPIRSSIPAARNVSLILSTARARVSTTFPVPVPSHHPFSLSSIPAILLPPLVFTGLLITLWTYKCLMMIIFQNKIIYMPSIPPFSRSEKVSDYAAQCRPVVWHEHHLQTDDGVTIKLLEGRINPTAAILPNHVVVLYLQGNASSLPPRLPYLSAILKALQPNGSGSASQTSHTIFALSYRGFWTSHGHATQKGIELDVQAALTWLSTRHARSEQNPTEPRLRLVLWGQSLGAAAATTALATHLSSSTPTPTPIQINTLILETPFPSLRTLLSSIYPQPYLPYRHLWPFLRSTWDSEAAIESIAQSQQSQQQHPPSPPLRKILLLRAGKDELVPAAQSEALERLCRRSLQPRGVKVECVVVAGALHTGVLGRGEGRGAVVGCLREVGLLGREDGVGGG